MSRRLLAASTLALAAACAATPDDASQPKLALGPLSPDDYAAFVQPVVERRCGSLDCHGQLPRGLRVYGREAMRLPNDAGLVPGGGATSPAEARATYDSIVGLQPEKTNELLQKQSRTPDDAYQLILLTKATGIERHRPGPSLQKGEPAEQCLVTWLIGHVDQDVCSAAVPKQP